MGERVLATDDVVNWEGNTDLDKIKKIIVDHRFKIQKEVLPGAKRKWDPGRIRARRGHVAIKFEFHNDDKEHTYQDDRVVVYGQTEKKGWALKAELVLSRREQYYVKLYGQNYRTGKKCATYKQISNWVKKVADSIEKPEKFVKRGKRPKVVSHKFLNTYVSSNGTVAVNVGNVRCVRAVALTNNVSFNEERVYHPDAKPWFELRCWYTGYQTKVDLRVLTDTDKWYPVAKYKNQLYTDDLSKWYAGPIDLNQMDREIFLRAIEHFLGSMEGTANPI